MDENGDTYVPVTYERCQDIAGPFYHGTKSALAAGDELVAGFGHVAFGFKLFRVARSALVGPEFDGFGFGGLGEAGER